MVKTKVTDIRHMILPEGAPPGAYMFRIADYLHDGRALMQITEGEYAGYFFIAPLPGPAVKSTLH